MRTAISRRFPPPESATPSGGRFGPLTALDPQPGHEADDTEPAVDDVHDRRRVVAGDQEQRNADGKSTAIQTSQNSTQPRAIPYVARIEPVRIQASASGPQDPNAFSTK